MEGEKLASDGSNNINLNQSVRPNKEIRSAAAYLADPSFMPSSSQCHEGKGMDSISIQDESQERLIQLPSSPISINTHGVLGEMLFDVCVAKDVEDWELKQSSSLRAPPGFPSSRRPSNFNPIKCIIRSRL